LSFCATHRLGNRERVSGFNLSTASALDLFVHMKTENPHIEELLVVPIMRGDGSAEFPFRRVIQIFRRDGEKVAENDPLAPEYPPKSEKDNLPIAETNPRFFPETYKIKT
jgi:hypothetical protein